MILLWVLHLWVAPATRALLVALVPELKGLSAFACNVIRHVLWMMPHKAVLMMM